MIRKADKRDLDSIRRCAAAAYRKYVERIGRKPAPIVGDFEASSTEVNLKISSFFAYYPTLSYDDNSVYYHVRLHSCVASLRLTNCHYLRKQESC
jgi:hypothetical protein